MRFFITLSLLVTTTCCLSQQKFVSLFKNDGEYAHSSDSADYIRVITQPDSGSHLYNVSEYYIKGETKLIGKSSTTDFPVFEGSCIRYYKNTNKQSITNYSKGFIVGIEYDYYPNGKLYQIIKHPDTASIHSPPLRSFLIIAENDSTGKTLVTNGNGYYKGYDDSLKTIVEEGKIINGLKDSVWKGRSLSQRITFTENYNNGILLSGVSIGLPGDTVKYSKSRNIEPNFKGGVKDFYTFIARTIRYPANDRENNIQGKVILKFIVEKNGKLSNIKIIKSVSESIDKEAADVIRSSPDWIPGTMYGRPVRVSYTIPLAFSLGN